MVQKCVRSRYQPLLLLYTNPYPTLLPVQTAPQKTTMHPGYKKPTHSKKTLIAAPRVDLYFFIFDAGNAQIKQKDCLMALGG